MRSPFDVRHLAIALTSFAVVFYEVLVTRILSVVLWYHWAFLSISLAMLGLGAPGVWFSLRPAGAGLLPVSLFSGAVLLPASVVAIVNYGAAFGPYSALFCMACILMPMLALGVAICILLLQAPGPAIARMYGADLLGASLAALLIIPALDTVPTPQLGAVLGALPLLSGLLLLGRANAAAGSPPPAGLSRSAGAAVGACIGLALVAVVTMGPLQITQTKTYDERNLKPLFEKWTHTARLVFFDGLHFGKRDNAFAWGMGKKAPELKVDQIWMEQDSSAGTPITRFDGDLDSVSFLNFDVTTVPYQLAPLRRVAIIGAGGGRDILSAALAGVPAVDAVEMNRHIVETVSGRFRDFSGDVYNRKGVRPVVSEGRSFLTRARGPYDLIQISFVDSWAATAAGAFSLSENNLYTVEAYQLYWHKLSERGMISTTRWMKAWMRMEMVRLIALSVEAMRGLGVAQPQRHLAVVGAGTVGTVLVSKRAFGHEALKRLRQICERRGFRLHYPPAPRASAVPVAASSASAELDIAEIVEKGPGRWQQQGLDLSPPTDDRPFFFQVLPVFSLTSRQTALGMGFNGDAVYALQVLMAALVACALALFFLPFALSRWMPRARGFWRGTCFFACIGLGFMFVEIPWLQRFILFLGHPSVATTVVLGAVLLGAGLGSMASTGLGLAGLQRWGLAVALLIGAANTFLPWVFNLALGLSWAVRVLIAVLWVMPVGFVLGMFLPLGMVRFGDQNKAWFWAVNGACSVVASVFSLALAMALGFTAVAWLGALFYLLAWLALGPSIRPSEGLAPK